MTPSKNFSIREALKWGFSTLMDHFWFFLKINLVFFLFNGLLYSLAIFRGHWNQFFSPPSIGVSFGLFFIYYLLFLLAEEYYLFHMTRIGFAFYDGKPIEWTSIFELKNFFTFFGARWLFMIKVFLGTLLLVIPGFYLFCKYFFTGYPIIDGVTSSANEDKNIVQEVTAGVRGKIFWYQCLLSILTGLSYITVITLVFLPVFYLANVHVYRKLLAQGQKQAI